MPVLLLFYRRIFFLCLCISLVGCGMACEAGVLPALSLILMLKTGTYGAMFYFNHVFSSHIYVFYHNLGWSKRGLWMGVFLLDSLLLAVLLWMTHTCIIPYLPLIQSV